jgi:hypothetical protein
MRFASCGVLAFAHPSSPPISAARATPFSENLIVSAFSGACLARSACVVSAREGLLVDLPPDARANALRRLNACVLRS